MLRNFFKVGFRNLARNKGFAVINIAGLAVGMASAALILLWIQNELGHDRFHEKIDRLYIMYNRDHFSGQQWAWNSTPKIMATALKKDYPEVEEVTRVTNADFLCTVGDRKLKGSSCLVDSGFLQLFTFPLIRGDKATALSNPFSMVVTEAFARKMWGGDDAMGKTIRLDSTDIFTVTGVLKDLPNNTIFKFEYLLPWSYMDKLKWNDAYWGNNSVQTYVLLRKGASQQRLDARVRDITINHTKGTGDPSTTEVFTWPLAKLWLYSRNENGRLVAGRMVTVRLFAVIAAFILLIACINFMNLSTARSEKRAREVGIRKVAGAGRTSLIFQFTGESTLIATFSGIIAWAMVQLSLGSFDVLVGKQLFLDYGDYRFWLYGFGFILLTGVLAGSYPALFLSSFKPATVLKGSFKAAHAVVNPRKVLVVLQFTFAIILIICTMIITRQINYAESRNTGYDRDRLVYSSLTGDTYKNYDLIKQELLNSGAAVAVTKSMSPITHRNSDSWGFSWPGSTKEDSKLDFVRMSTDADFTKAMGITLLQGRDIDIREFPADSNAVLLNETAVRKMRLKNAVGTLIRSDDEKWVVVGVVKDFIVELPYEPVNPMMINGPSAWFNVLHYKLNPANPVAEDIRRAEKVFKDYNPQYPFEYHFVDEEYAKKFEDTKQTGTLAALFAGLTVFISCLGLFGLAMFMAATRMREIGVRKVLGASVTSITALLSKDFLKLVTIAIVIATPIAWYAMKEWLGHYTYNIGVEWWIFVLAGVLSLVIALATVSFQAIRSAIANPVKSLRTE
ncbi:MAG TPA: ABC transporter permease [Puia sp.]|nr:ABC transporter permease [Puia sp.]